MKTEDRKKAEPQSSGDRFSFFLSYMFYIGKIYNLYFFELLIKKLQI